MEIQTFGIPATWGLALVVGFVLLGIGVLAAFVVVAFRLRGWRGISGMESLIGSTGRVKAKTHDGLIVHVGSDDWWATDDSEDFYVGQTVEVTAVEGLRLRVRALAGEEKPGNKKSRR
jgi:membrane-bound ClpP family serine protease